LKHQNSDSACSFRRRHRDFRQASHCSVA